LPDAIIFDQMLKRFFHEHLIESGCDEAGRGCLAGPVYAAAVILPKTFKHKLLNDSKQMTEEDRYRLRPIIEKNAIAWAVGISTHEEIDSINILNASLLAMHRALDQLPQEPELLLIDGNRFKKYRDIPHECVIGGDGIYMSIAAASVLAKTYRDDYMISLHNDFPQYKWNTNKGYGTPEHRVAIADHGFTPFHRRSFRLLPEQIELEF
jgi:ribonuclease HII